MRASHFGSRCDESAVAVAGNWQLQPPVFAQHDVAIGGGYRPGKVVTLHLLAAVAGEECQLRRGFHTFGDDFKAQTVRHADDGEGNGGIVIIGGDVAHEKAVDF